MKWTRALALPAAAVAAVAVRDLTQKQHAILHNFPVLGHARYLLEKVGPELRQYIVTDNNDERPFSRDQRRWVYASAKRQNPYFGFGTDNDVERNEGYAVIKHRTFADVQPAVHPNVGEETPLPCAKVLGEPRGRRHAFRPASTINVSAMSYGALSGPAVEALNRGCALAGALHNTGEGGISVHHRHGADLVFQIGTAYFGCRDGRGRFDLERLKDLVAADPVRAIEVKLSQGAKPGLGGLLPAAKISEEIAQIRGIPLGEDCHSPSRHAEFSDADSMLDFVELLAAETGLPVGIKSAVGQDDLWQDLARMMSSGDRGVDFIAVDGGEGGTGAAPLTFSDSVSLPFRLGFPQAYAAFAREGIADRVVWIGSGKLGLPENAAVAFALGVDLVNVAREAMMSIGCIQAQRCHDDRCPTGVATQNAWLTRGLDPDSKSERAANYLRSWRREMLKVAEACGVQHPGLIGGDMVDILLGTRLATPLWQTVGYDDPGWGLPSRQQQEDIRRLMVGAPEGGSAPPSSTAVDAPDEGREEGAPGSGDGPARDSRIDDSATPG
ncbi:FMN-binding glutamate synthase family protein [Ornithinimicrobium cerasi]|uniref:Glutamate synthase domain-containing protein 2 n=1 Tax=Ornithinimicrobium cerasi TaxID=2248773 RepID=A0A285VKL4_9MICO|nr:FMN-binding glutamate synthase family protein [Ornithinimicrobium cerasi]SOC54622.1 Glutamate synthase domain-containing protein 2 [Ornithinimicrobium cerasi]